MTTPDMSRGTNTITRPRMLVGAACWILGPLAYFVGQGIAQAAWTMPYSMITNYVSDLGAAHCETQVARNLYVCSPLHAATTLGFIALGVLTLFGLVLLAPFWPRRRLTTCGYDRGTCKTGNRPRPGPHRACPLGSGRRRRE